MTNNLLANARQVAHQRQRRVRRLLLAGGALGFLTGVAFGVAVGRSW